MRRLHVLLLLAGVIIFGAMMQSDAVHASGMSIAPLEYRTNLKQGEFKKGFVDIVNPELSSVDVGLSVQAFRQVNDQGGLEFYDNKNIASGIKLDLEDIELGPGEGARIYFQLDASKLPSGDVFAALFAVPKSNNKSVLSVPSARVGTLLMIENGTPPVHHAKVQKIDTNWLQVGDGISARLLVKNTDPSGGSAIGFSPKINVALQPYASRTVDGPLVFAERSREVAYRQAGSYFGPLVVQASIDGKSTSRIIFAVTGYWRWLAPLLLVVFAVILIVLKRIFIRSKKHNKNDENPV